MKALLALCPLFVCAEITYEHLQDEILSVHVLNVNPEEIELKIINCDGVEKTSVIAELHGAIAAVNGGFYKEDGSPSGVLKIEGVLFSETDRSRGALGWKPFLIDRLDDEFTPIFHPENKDLWNATQYILGTTPVLIIDGMIPNFNEESVRIPFLKDRFARTAMGIKNDGHLLFVLVEQNTQSVGMTIAELADFMISQDCKQAINFCGGYSSTLCFDDNIVYGAPLEEKPVGNVVILCQSN